MKYLGRRRGGSGFLGVARRRPPSVSRQYGCRLLSAGAALATILLVTSVAPTPAAAAEQIQIPVELITLNDIRILVNNSKLDTTFGTTINNLNVAASAIAATNFSFDAGLLLLEDLTQVIDGTQTIRFNNFISITNSGEIDPLVGINGQINNIGIFFEIEAAAISNVSGQVGGLSLGDLSQYLYLSQSNYATNTIRESNSAKITADLFGMFAEINNLEIASFANAATAANINGRADIVSAGQHIQLIDLHQINQLSNSIQIFNSGEIDPAVGIFAGINNSFTAAFANAIEAANVNGEAAAVDADTVTQVIEFHQANVLGNSIAINNSGPIDASRSGIWAEINNFDILGFRNTAESDNINGDAAVLNFGDHRQAMHQVQTNSISNDVSIENQGPLYANVGILATVTNEGIVELFNNIESRNISGSAEVFDFDDRLQTFEGTQTNLIDNEIYVTNDGEIEAGDTGISAGIGNLDISLENSLANENTSAEAAVTVDDLTQTSTIHQSNTLANDLTVVNQGKVTAGDTGIAALIENRNIEFTNSTQTGNALASDAADEVTQTADVTQSNVISNSIGIANSGEVRGRSIGIATEIINQAIEMANIADVESLSEGTAGGDFSQTANVNQSNRIENKIKIVNTGKVSGGDLGIYASISEPEFTAVNIASVTLDAGTASVSQSNEVDSSIVIDNAGYIGADSLFAIDTVGASTTIYNRGGGVIKGYVDLTDEGDKFFNEAGGTFQARKQSDFGAGSDLFQNRGTVHTSEKLGAETTSFVNLERFENSGLISLVDGQVGDMFTISNAVGGTDLDYVASEGARLGVDAFLGGPGSTADNFVIQGNASGRTLLQVANTNPGGGAYNPQGIPVAFVDGDVKRNAFYLERPIDAGFFDYDLYFVPTGSGLFELRSHPGGGSHVLPHVVTVTHDIFHNTTETWFDQSTDLRVLLAQGDVCDEAGRREEFVRCQALYDFAPGVWARGAGSWFELDDRGTTRANGRTYHYDLARDLDIWQIQSGIDFGKRDVLLDGDILVLGVLGGAVESTLDYERLARGFQVSSLEAGAYATYLRGGFFVDTLFKTLFSEIDTGDLRGFPDSFDGTTYGFRTDTGYRFGGLQPGPFIEPLATIAVSWTHIDDFARDGNAIDFNDDEDVRGRLGLRVGTSSEVWERTTMEPFVVGSLWGNLSGDHSAKLTSGRREFRFVDDTEDVWGEVSGGVNFFNPGAQTAVFAKIDYVFGDETQGVTAKGGMRYNW